MSHTETDATTPSNTAPVAPPTLSQVLRKVSFGGHGGGDDWTGEGDGEAAKREPQYATAFLRGGLNREGIAAQVAQHFLMYEALEAATEVHRERLGDDFEFWMPELHRLPALRADLQHWLGDNWEAEVRERYATPGILDYVARINEVAPTSYPLFVAHHYTRYLADLSGGFMIVKMFRDSYGLDTSEGTEFYDFPEIDNPNAYKERYRELLDSLDFTAEEQQQLAEEVALAYRMNNTAGADLEARFAEYQA